MRRRRKIAIDLLARSDHMASYVADNVSIHPRAEIDADVEIGPFCVIGPNVRIGRGTRLENNVTLMGHVTHRRTQPSFSGRGRSAASRRISATGEATRK